MNNQYIVLNIIEYLPIKELIKLLDSLNNNKDNIYYLYKKELLNKFAQKIINFFKYSKNINYFEKNVLNNDNFYYRLGKKHQKKLLISLFYYEYTPEYRLSWYNTNVGWKRDIVNKYRKGEFENKESLTRYEFFRFQSQFDLDEIVAIGF